MELGVPNPLGPLEPLSCPAFGPDPAPTCVPLSLPEGCSGCWQHQAFYPSQHLFLTISYFKTRVSVAVTDVSTSCGGVRELLPPPRARDTGCLWDVQSVASAGVFVSQESRQEREAAFW